MSAPETLPFGGLLRRLRLEAGLTQEALAERAAVSERGLRYLETGRRAPYPATVVRLAEALGLSPASRSQLVAAASADARGRVPPAPGPALLGREGAVGDVVSLLLRGERLVTVTGVGGVGKTSLAREAAGQLESAFDDGTLWVPLERVDASERVLPSVLASLGARGPDLDAAWADRVVEAIGSRRLLLVLDNFEHVAAAAPLVAEVLARCPALSVLTTSRVPLNLRAETEYWLGPLETPDAADVSGSSDALAWPAVVLFERRARAVDRAFAVTDGNAKAVARLCRELDGLPLSLELAAARVRVASPAEMLEAGGRLDLLSGGPVDAPLRQRTARDALDWSYRLLGASERSFLRRLAVFRGGATLGAVAAVAGEGDGSEPRVAGGLEALRRASLVNRAEHDGVSRISLLQTVREYALEQLAAHPDQDRDVRDRHASFFAELALQSGHDVERHPAAVLSVFDAERENLRLALERLRETGRTELGLSVCSASWVYRDIRGHVQEGIAFLESFLTAAGDDVALEARGQGLLAMSQLERIAGAYPAAHRHAVEALAVFRATGDVSGIAHGLLGAGFIARLQGRTEEARASFSEGLELAHAAGDQHMIAAHLHHLGMLASMVDGDAQAARPLLEESLRRFRELGYPRFVSLLLALLGSVAETEGNGKQADALLAESLEVMALSGISLGVFWPLNEMATVAARRGHARRAVVLASAADGLRVLSGAHRLPHVQAWMAQLRRDLGDAEFEAQWATGQSLGLDEAMEYAVSQGA